MRICFISFFSYPLFNPKCATTFGGAEVQLFNLAKDISNDNEVSFIVGNFGQKKEEVFDNIKVIKSVCPGNKSGIIKKIKSIFEQYAAMKKSDADIFIKMAAGSEVGMIALYCKILRKKFIYMTAHEIDCSGEYKKKNWLLGMLYEFGLKNADLVITQSVEHKKLLKKNYKINSFVLKNGYAIPKINIEQKSDFILWIARLESWKQPELFIEIAKQFTDYKFIMIAAESSDKAYAEKIKKYALENKIKFIPGLPFVEVDHYFKTAKIFVNTSKYEGFPNTFIQAAMHGTPVISLNVNPDNMLNEYKMGFFSDNNFKKLTDDINYILNSEDIYKKISDNAYAYALNNHDIRIVSREFLTLVNKIYKDY